MAETLTYDSGIDPVTTEENLTPEEQDSLEVGEKLVAEQENLLAGKYKDAEELEKAYIELQKKLGTEDKEEETEASNESEPEQEPEELSPATQLIVDASLEFNEKGELAPETLSKFEGMSSQDLVSAYMDMQSKVGDAEPQQQEAPDLTDAQVNTIKNSAGGEEAYRNIIGWAEQNLPKDTVQAFDALCDSGNVDAIQLAVNGLKAQYENANGYEGRMLSGKPPQTSGDVYRSQAELVSAMSDPRYDNDPAFRMDVMEKLDRSDIQF